MDTCMRMTCLTGIACASNIQFQGHVNGFHKEKYCELIRTECYDSSFPYVCCIVRQVVTSVLKDHSAFTFDCLSLKVKALQTFETLGSAHPEDLNAQQHHCNNVRSLNRMHYKIIVKIANKFYGFIFLLLCLVVTDKVCNLC
jgi:hypothetical protein